MKAVVFIFLFVIYSIECRKVYNPLDKNANIDFINMEGGGARPGPSKPVTQIPPKTPIGPPQPANPPAQGPAANPPKPLAPAPTPKPVSVTVPLQPSPAAPAKPQSLQPAQPVPKPTTPGPKPQAPNQIKPVPVNPSPVTNPITTPGYGTVKQLVNFYDSQGKASPIRPYSYSQAVKQG